MRVQIVRPLPAVLEDIPVDQYVFAASYEIASPLCDLLLAEGYAIPVDRPLTNTPSRKPTARRKAKRPRSRPRHRR